MKDKYKKIWELALPYQDKRDDKGHAKIVTEYTFELCQIEKANEIVAVAAAILHDIGWSKLSQEERLNIFGSKITPEAEYEIRLKHQNESVKLAKKILNTAKYPIIYFKDIFEIISEHDTREGFLSSEDGVMRDADKLWRYSQKGFQADLSRNNFTFDFLYNKMLKNIDRKNYFCFDSARDIARQELENRRREFSE
ncbi:MAG TPA: hypothetical protein DDY52_00350 [Candidatus Moranbacteria bacterium]|nr:MAG: HD domain protein [Candidatus Moranbacteria bacterium GW2011_GWF1_34_10]HBI16599.1 hypothetical protein [Candidatus Moranbacteria bacterium]